LLISDIWLAGSTLNVPSIVKLMVPSTAARGGARGPHNDRAYARNGNPAIVALCRNSHLCRTDAERVQTVWRSSAPWGARETAD